MTNLQVGQWVQVERGPLTPTFGQVTKVDGDKFSFVNVRGEFTEDASKVSALIDIDTFFAGQEIPAFVKARMAG
jgi:transcription antitermination factor NusG